jgi:hypothetical protein
VCDNVELASGVLLSLLHTTHVGDECDTVEHASGVLLSLPRATHVGDECDNQEFTRKPPLENPFPLQPPTFLGMSKTLGE